MIKSKLGTIFTFLFLISLTLPAFGEEEKKEKINNVTGKAKNIERKAIFNEPKNPGFRLAWLGMKEKNGLHGIGVVNGVVRTYEDALFDEFEKKLPGVDLTITKTDFKGYYLTCKPSTACEGKGIIEEVVRNMAPVTFEGSNDQFGVLVTEADNYKEGYVKARVQAEYPDFDPKKDKLHNFIDKKMKAAFLEATGKPDFGTLDLADKDIIKGLEKDIDLYRSGAIDKVSTKNRELIRGLDSLLEVPYDNSENIDEALKIAMDKFDLTNKEIGYHSMRVETGDDLFKIVHLVEENAQMIDGKMVMVKTSKVVRVIGADARGLGRANMMARFYKYGEIFKSGKSIDSMTKVLTSSNEAIEKVNFDMEKSMTAYSNSVDKVLEQENLKLRGKAPLPVVTSSVGPIKPVIKTLDQVIASANNDYIELIAKEKPGSDVKLMEMRAGSVCNCDGQDIKVVMNRITATHNRLKLMEKAGYHGHFGTSCIGVEYWIKKLGIPVD